MVRGGRGEAATVSMTEPTACSLDPHSLCGPRGECLRLVCSVCIRVDTVPSWDGPCRGKISSLLPHQRTISLHTSLGNSSDRSSCSHADALEPLTNQVGPGCQQPLSPRCVRPEGLGRELRPAHNPSPSQPQPGHTSSPLSPSALMTGHSAVLGAGGQEQNRAEPPPSSCPLTPPPRGRARVKCTVSPAPRSFWRSRGHSDLRGSWRKRRWKSLGVGTQPGQAGGSGPGVAVRVPPRERPRGPPETPGPEAAEPCRHLLNCRQRRLLASSEAEHQGLECPPARPSSWKVPRITVETGWGSAMFSRIPVPPPLVCRAEGSSRAPS